MEVIKNLLRKCIALQENQIYDAFINQLEDYIINLNNGSIHDLKTIKKNKNKIKGDIFELLCVNLLKNNSIKNIKCKDAWLFKDIPHDIFNKLGFNNRRDMGIDIVLLTKNDEWYAIQCKYRSVKKYKSITLKNKDGEYFEKKIYNQVEWKDLSTFYSLCERTGINKMGWSKHVVMTTAESINRQGRKNDKDLSICVGTFRGLSKEEWFKLLGDIGNTIGDGTKIKISINKPDLDLIRQKRLLALCGNNQ